MKKYIVMIVTLMMGVQSKSQGPVMPYNNDIYSVEDVFSFATGTSDASKAFASFVVERCQQGLNAAGYKTNLTNENINWIFKNSSIEEIYLGSGTFYNSYWDRKNRNLHFFLSKDKYEGMAGVFNYKNCRIILWKGNCVNALKVQFSVKEETKKDPIFVEEPLKKPEEKVAEKCYNYLTITKTSVISKKTGMLVETRYDTTGEKKPGCENSYSNKSTTEYTDEQSSGTCCVEQPRRQVVVCQPPRRRPQFWGYVQVGYRSSRQMMPPPQQQTPHGYMGGGRVVNHGYMGGGNTSSGNHGNMGGGSNNNGGNMGPGRKN